MSPLTLSFVTYNKTQFQNYFRLLFIKNHLDYRDYRNSVHCLRQSFITPCNQLRLTTMASVKPFKSKNRDKIDLDAPNSNLKKGCDRDFLRQGLIYKILYGFIG